MIFPTINLDKKYLLMALKDYTGSAETVHKKIFNSDRKNVDKSTKKLLINRNLIITKKEINRIISMLKLDNWQKIEYTAHANTVIV
jgi:hypothetical protein